MAEQRNNLRADFLAGITGAIAGAPQAMGFALIAGVSPLYGLYGAVVATIVGAFSSSSTYMTIAPTNALSLLVFSTLATDGDVTIEKLFLLTFLTGIFQLLFGIFKLGSLTRFVSNAVMTGFIVGAGLLIILGQISHLNGYEPHYEGLWASQLTKTLPNFADWLIHLPQSHPQTLIIGIVSVIIIAGLHETRFKSIATLVAIIVTSIWVNLTGWSDVPLVRDMASIPAGLPLPVIPPFQYTLELIPSALAMAVLALVQSSGITQSITEPDGSHPDTNRDFIAQGLANIVGGFFQNMPAGGSLSRTAVNISAGAKTKLANILSGVFIAVILLSFGSLIEQITLAALAGHLVVAAFSLFKFDIIKMVWNVRISGRIAFVTTFASTLILPLEYSIYIGVILSLALFAYSAALRLEVVRLIPEENNLYKAVTPPETLPDSDIIIFSVHGHMFFAAVKQLEMKLPDAETCHNTIVILRIRNNDYLGSTGIRFLREYKRNLEAHGGRLILAGLSTNVHNQLERTHMFQEFGADNIFDASNIYFEATGNAYQYARTLLPETTQP